MIVEESPRNLRCDTASCKNFATHTINTSSYKGNISLCDDCMKNLFAALKKLYQTAKSKEKK